MTADTTAWHHATVDREGDDRLFVHVMGRLLDAGGAELVVPAQDGEPR